MWICGSCCRRYFLLDSVLRVPLTLRDYSKVCWGRKSSLRMQYSSVQLRRFRHGSVEDTSRSDLLPRCRLACCPAHRACLVAQSTGGESSAGWRIPAARFSPTSRSRRSMRRPASARKHKPVTLATTVPAARGRRVPAGVRPGWLQEERAARCESWTSTRSSR